jgi:DNA-binding MarR family transcriptional regulator
MTTWQEVDDLRRAIDHIFAQEARRYKVTPLEMHVVLTLFERDGQRAGDLAQAVRRDHRAFTPILDSLVSKGLIERRSKGRAVYLHLTTLGTSLRAPLTAGAGAADIAAQLIVERWQAKRMGIDILDD